MHSGVSKFLLPGGAGGSADNEIQVPWGIGVLGHVAESGETVNIQIACEVSVQEDVKGRQDMRSIGSANFPATFSEDKTILYICFYSYFEKWSRISCYFFGGGETSVYI